MKRPTQAQNFSELSEFDIRQALWRRRWSVAELARRIGRPRPTVSKAITLGRFPRVRRQIEEALTHA